MRFVDLKREGYLFGQIPINLYKEIDTEIQELLDTNFNGAETFADRLAGALEHEYLLWKSHVAMEEFINSVAGEYFKNSMWFDPIGKKLNLDRYWCNFQKKNEYNPIHTHSGHLSFVIWHKIPYDAAEEAIAPNRRQINGNPLDLFQFVYPDAHAKGGVNNHNLQIDKSFEGMFALFSNDLSHVVYPFYTSDDWRISLSGNLTVRDESNEIIRYVGRSEQ